MLVLDGNFFHDFPYRYFEIPWFFHDFGLFFKFHDFSRSGKCIFHFPGFPWFPRLLGTLLWSNHKAEAEAEALNFSKHEALAFSKHDAKAEAEAQVLPSYHKYPFLPLITCPLLEFRQNGFREAEAEAEVASYPCLYRTHKKPVYIYYIECWGEHFFSRLASWLINRRTKSIISML